MTSRANPPGLRWNVPCAVVALAVAACSGPNANDKTTLVVPDESMWVPVSDVLEVRCGTLDCHGSPYRDFRLFGHYGQRASSMDVTGQGSTQDPEYHRNYLSIISIDPEAMNSLVTKHGQGFDHWIIVTKGTNAEHHKGGERMKKGDESYACLLSWITGMTDMTMCTAGLNVMPPGGNTF